MVSSVQKLQGQEICSLRDHTFAMSEHCVVALQTYSCRFTNIVSLYQLLSINWFCSMNLPILSHCIFEYEFSTYSVLRDLPMQLFFFVMSSSL